MEGLHNRDAKQRAGEKRGAFKRRILGDYKFALAMENAVVKDYVSEKVFDALAGRCCSTAVAQRLLPDEGAILRTADFPDASGSGRYSETPRGGPRAGGAGWRARRTGRRPSSASSTCPPTSTPRCAAFVSGFRPTRRHGHDIA